MSRTDKEWLDKVAQLGCVVCRNLGYGESPAAIHHIRHGVGMGQRQDNYHVIPLCPNHHQHGGFGIAFHAGPREFEKRYGTELELLHQTIEDVKKLEANIIA